MFGKKYTMDEWVFDLASKIVKSKHPAAESAAAVLFVLSAAIHRGEADQLAEAVLEWTANDDGVLMAIGGKLAVAGMMKPSVN